MKITLETSKQFKIMLLCKVCQGINPTGNLLMTGESKCDHIYTCLQKLDWVSSIEAVRLVPTIAVVFFFFNGRDERQFELFSNDYLEVEDIPLAHESRFRISKFHISLTCDLENKLCLSKICFVIT